MGRTEKLHPRQREIDNILLANPGKGTYETVLSLLREAGIDPRDLSPDGQAMPTGLRLDRLRYNAKQRVEREGAHASLISAAQEATRRAQEVKAAERAMAEAEERLSVAKAHLEDAQKRLAEESARLSG